MKKILFYFVVLATLLAASSILIQRSAIPITKHSSAPGSTALNKTHSPDELTPDLIHAGINKAWLTSASEYLSEQSLRIHEKNEVFTGRNRESGLVFNCKSNTLKIQPLVTNGELIELKLSSIKRGNAAITFSGSYQSEALTEKELKINLGDATIEYQNTKKGLRQNFIIHQKTNGHNPLEVILSHESPYTLTCEEGKTVAFKNNLDETIITYSDLKVWDSNHQPLLSHMAVYNNNIALVVDDRNAAYPITVDPIWVVPGTQSGNFFGNSIAAGDLNGDGVDDIAITEPMLDFPCPLNNSITLTDAGAIHVWYGVPNGNMPVTPNWTAKETQDGSGIWSMESMTASGDINNDGYNDLIVGNRFHDASVGACSPSSNHSGTVFIWLGSAVGLSNGMTQVDMSNATYTIGSVQNGAKFGASVTTGDFNNDGNDDIIAGCPHWDNNNAINPNENYGKAYLFYGDDVCSNPQGSLLDAETNANWIIQGNSIGERLGSGLITTGDVNGDQITDFVISADGYTNTPNGAVGAAFLWLGQSSKRSGLNHTLTSSPPDWKVHTETGATPRNFGHNWHTNTDGDFNQDGFNDIVIQDLHFNSGKGAIYLWYGSASIGSNPGTWNTTSSPDWFYHHKLSYTGTAPHFGYRFLIEDINNDSYDDLISMASEDHLNDGKVFIWYGNYNGLGSSNRAADWSYVPKPGGSGHSGQGLATGDFNGDGSPELAIGSPDLNGIGEAELTKPAEGKGLFVGDFNQILGDEHAENLLISYAHQNGYSRLYLYDLHKMLPTVSSGSSYPTYSPPSCGFSEFRLRPDALKNFIVKAHTHSSVNGLALEVFSAVSGITVIDNKLMPFEAYYYPTNPLAYFDGFITEIEFWNPALNCGMWNDYETTITTIKNNPSYHQFHSKGMHSYLGRYLENIIPAPGSGNSPCTTLSSATVTKSYLYQTIINNNDMIYIEAYKPNPVAITTPPYTQTFDYLRSVLCELAYYTHALNRRNTKVGAIFASDCRYSGGWLQAGGSIGQAQQVFESDINTHMANEYLNYTAMHYPGALPYQANLKIIQPAVFKYRSIQNAVYCDPVKTEESNAQMSFDGNDDYVSICNATNGSTGLSDRLNNATEFTIEGWVKAALPGSGKSTVFTIDNGSQAFTIGYDYPLGYYYLLTPAHSGAIQISSAGNNINTCKHLAITYKNGVLLFYENGSYYNSLVINGSPLIPVGTDIYFGGNPAQPDYFHGMLDEFRIWTTQRTEEQINGSKQLSINPAAANMLSSTNLLAYWKFDELPGSQMLIDETGEWRYRGRIGSTFNADIQDPVAGVSGNTVCYTNNENVAILFDGTDDYLKATVGSPSSSNLETTIEFWFSPDASGGSSNATIMSNINTNNFSGTGFKIYYDPLSGELHVECPILNIGSGTGMTVIKKAIPGSGCHHFAISFNSTGINTDIKTYYNGFPDNVYTSTVSITERDFFTNTHNLYIGAEDNTLSGGSPSVTDIYKGTIDEIRIYEYEASASDIATYWNQKLQFGLNNFHAYWHMDDYLSEQYGAKIRNAGDDNSFYFSKIETFGEPIPVSSCTPIPVNYSELVSPSEQEADDVFKSSSPTERKGIKKVSDAYSKSSIYPNPVTDILNAAGTDNGRYIIHDVCGKTVLEGFLSSKQIDVSTLKGGIYFIEFHNEQYQKQQFKFIKQ